MRDRSNRSTTSQGMGPGMWPVSILAPVSMPSGKRKFRNCRTATRPCSHQRRGKPSCRSHDIVRRSIDCCSAPSTAPCSHPGKGECRQGRRHRVRPMRSILSVYDSETIRARQLPSAESGLPRSSKTLMWLRSGTFNMPAACPALCSIACMSVA